MTTLVTTLLARADNGGVRNVLNVHQLPLGDGKISLTPRRGYVMVCSMYFPQRGGAKADAPWIHGDTWDLTQKLAVEGSVTWPQAQFQITRQGDYRIVRGNGLPVNTPTGIFPISPDDPAFQIDRNPNSILPQNVMLKLPINPTIAPAPSCVPMGMVGIALNGVAIFNALDAAGRDAVAHEVQDLCNGHAQQQGMYHYHGPSPCLLNETRRETLIGYAIDGFGIYSMYDAHGRELTDVDLDACHGRTSEVEWNGKRQRIYHYVLTHEYPYTLGCLRGTPVRAQRSLFGQPRSVPPGFPFRRPPDAFGPGGGPPPGGFGGGPPPPPPYPGTTPPSQTGE